MSFPVEIALRYLGSRKRAFISVGTLFAVLGVALGSGMLVTVMSVTGGFRAAFRDKVLGVNAHVLVLKYTSDFREYRGVMEQVATVPGVEGVAPFVINPMMVTHGKRTATGVLLKGVDPEAMPRVLDLPRYVTEGSLDGMRLPGARPPERRRASAFDVAPPRRAPRAAASASAPTESVASSPAPSGAVPADSARPPAAPTAPATSEHAAGSGAPPPGDRKAMLRALQEAMEAPPNEPEEAAVVPFTLPPGAPEGEIEPEGGYSSELPDEDVIDDSIDPDPCRHPQAVAALPGIVVGVTLKQNLALSLGDCVTVTSPTIGYAYSRGAVRAPVAKRFRVIAVFDAGFDQYDAKLVYTDLYEAQAFSDAGDSVTGVEMKVTDIDQASRVGDAIERILADGTYNIVDWEELNRGLFTALRIQQILLSVVLALIIVVAAFTVIATLIMVVLDKKREIAVLKAMGATDSHIFRAFLLQGGFVGVVGATLGLGLGWLLCEIVLRYGFALDPKVYFISRLPVQMRSQELVITWVFAVLTCLLATTWPALYAARLRPAEAFREQ